MHSLCKNGVILIRVSLYTRVSTEEQARHGISLEAQSAALHEWAESNGHVIVGEYMDDGISARKAPSKRPALQQLLRDIPTNKTELIAFTKLDRWTRNVKGYYQVQDALDRNKVSWIAVQEDYETITASGRFKVNIMLSVAENEADRTSERIKSIMEHKVVMGEAITNALPVGYKIENKRVVPDERAEAAQAVFDCFIRTANTQRARDMLDNIYGISLPLLSIRNMLRNELYLGRYRGNTEYCQPIIKPEVFAEAQRILDHRTVKQTHTRHTYLFSGLVFCGDCNHRMVGVSTSVLSYRCNQHYELKRCTHCGYYNEVKLESYITQHLNEVVAGYTAEYESEKKKTPQIDRAAIQRKLDRLKDLYVDGDIDKEKYKEERDKLTPLLEVKPTVVQKPTVVIGDDFLQHYAALSRQQKQEFWRNIIDRIVIDKSKQVSIFLR